MSGPGSRPQNAERNLIFAGLGMQLGILNREKIIRAFTEWLLDKNSSLGSILVLQKAITPEQRKVLEDACEAQIQVEGNQEAALASIRQVKDLESDLEHLDDADIQKSVLLTHSTKFIKAPHSDSVNGLFGSASGHTFIPPPGAPSDRFDPIQFLDAGSLGEVYFARDRELNRMVVVKFIKPEQSQNPLNRSLFHLEGEVTGYLEHPNITPVYGLGKDGRDRSYYAMRYIRGRKLTRAISQYQAIGSREKGLQHETLIGLLQGFQSACLAVEYAHTRGVIHCDLKPDNIMVGEFGETMVVDWGLVVVKSLGRPIETNPEITQDFVLDTSNFSPSRSAAGGLHEKQGGGRTYVGGTPAYMAPEQMKASETGDIDILSPASDVFGLGATLFHILTGRAPLLPEKDKKEAKSTYYRRIELASFPKPRTIRADIPKPLEAIVLKAMALEPARRYATARELADDIRRWVSDEPVEAYSESASERIRRWMRNNRVAVGVGSVLLICTALAGLSFGAITHSYNDQLRESESQAKSSALDANKAREIATRNENRALAGEKAARDQTVIAEVSAKAAQAQKELAESQLYVNKIQRAQSEWNYGDDLIARLQMESCPWDRRGFEHDYLATLMDRNQVTLKGHSGAITSVAFSSDGKRLLSGSGDNTAKLWDLLTGKELMVYRGHSDKVPAMSFKRETMFHIRELVTLKNLPMTKELLNIKERSNRVNGVAFRRDGLWVATASDDKTAKIWDTQSGKEVATLMGHLGEITALAFSPDGNRLATASEDRTVKIWDCKSGKDLLTLKGHGEKVDAVIYSPDGTKIVSTSDDNTAKIWDAADGRLLHTLKGHAFFVTSAAFRPDGKILATASLDRTIKLWDLATGKEIRTLTGHAKGVNSVAFSQDGHRLVSGGDDNAIKFWNPISGSEQESLKGNSMPIAAVAMSPDGTRIASGSDHPTLKIWNAQESQHTRTLLGQKGPLSCVATSRDGKLVGVGSLDKSAKIWDAETGAEVATLSGHTDRIAALAFTPDSSRMATASWDNSVRIWEARTGKMLLTIQGQSHAVNGVDFRQDGKRLVTGTLGGARTVFDAETGKEILTLKGPGSFTTCVRYSPDGRLIATAGWDKIVRICDGETGEEKLALKGHTDRISQLDFHPGGHRLASAGDDNTIRIWDIDAGKEIHQLRGHTSPVNAIVHSPDGRRIASGGDGKAIKIWDTEDGVELLTLKGHTDKVSGLAFRLDNGQLYSASYDRSLMIWDARDRSEVMTIKHQGGKVVRAGFSTDGKRVIALGEDKSLKAWNAVSGEELFDLDSSSTRQAIGQAKQTSPDGQWLLEIHGDEIHVIHLPLRSKRLERDRRRLEQWVQSKS